MIRTIQITADGSRTISIDEMKVTYHSKHGAIQESRHVFIEAGLKYMMQHFSGGILYVFEMGFGTGLNALLSLQFARQIHHPVFYCAAEKFPLKVDEWKQLGYGKQLGLEAEFELLHNMEWSTPQSITEEFVLCKYQGDLLEIPVDRKFHLIYFDAFAPSAQPELWTKDVFNKMLSMLHPGGMLVTYCSKGDVRRAMIDAGFEVEKIPGPRGKREMLRAKRPEV